jgi:hypothetical protein
MTRSAKEGDKALKKLDKSVGDNFRNVGNYKGAIQGLVSTLGTLGAGIGIGQIFRNVTGIMIDFDQAQADLSAISGKTKGELKGLTQQAKELGATTQFSATQITEMQIELAKLGFTTEQVTQSTDWFRFSLSLKGCWKLFESFWSGSFRDGESGFCFGCGNYKISSVFW